MKKLDDYAEGDKPEWPGESPFPRVAEMLAIFGQQTLLLSWPCGTKGTRKRWKHLTLESMGDPEYLRKLEGGNIGIALGPKSDWLCAIDLDLDELRGTFLARNPWARQTTEVRGQRGCKFFVRIIGDCPTTAHLKRNGQDVAQWLAEGTQAIVSGTHPAGMEYAFLNRAYPVEIEYSAIIWPPGLTVPRLKGDFTEHKKQQSTRASEQTSRRAADETEQPSDRENEAVLLSGVALAVQSATPCALAAARILPKAIAVAWTSAHSSRVRIGWGIGSISTLSIRNYQ
jgi:hypothetical protein